MSRQRKAREAWEYPSLEWIHRARELHYEEEQGQSLAQLKPRLSPAAAQVARRLRLKAVRASEISRARRRAG